MIVIQYDAGQDPRELLAAAIRLDPGRSYVVVPAELARRLGLGEQEPEPIPWAAPVGKCEAT